MQPWSASARRPPSPRASPPSSRCSSSSSRQPSTRSGVAELEKKAKHALVPSEWDYAPAPESREIVLIDERYGHFVGGEWLEPRETYTTSAPASEDPLAEVGQATPEEVQGAIATARQAFENGWSALPGSERAKYLFRVGRILPDS